MAALRIALLVATACAATENATKNATANATGAATSTLVELDEKKPRRRPKKTAEKTLDQLLEQLFDANSIKSAAAATQAQKKKRRKKAKDLDVSDDSESLEAFVNKLLASDNDDKDDAFSKLFGASDLAGLEAQLSKQARELAQMYFDECDDKVTGFSNGYREAFSFGACCLPPFFAEPVFAKRSRVCPHERRPACSTRAPCVASGTTSQQAPHWPLPFAPPACSPLCFCK